MVKLNKWLPWLLGISVLFNIGLLGGFIYHRHFMLPSPEQLEKAQSGLQLSHNQREQLIAIQRGIRDDARASMRDTHQHYQDLVNILRSDQRDLPALEQSLRAVSEPQVTLQRNVILRLLDFRDSLTPPQKVLFNDKMQHPGFLLRLAGFPGPMWRGHGCHRDGRHAGDHTAPSDFGQISHGRSGPDPLGNSAPPVSNPIH